MTHPDFPPTPEQTDILSSTGNIMIEAYAGCGKSATLHLLEAATPDPILFLAFNKKIAKDAEKKVSDSTVVRTFNSLGHRVWADTIGRKLVLNARKTADLTRAALQDLGRADASELWPEYRAICDAVDMMKTMGYIPTGNANHHKSLSTDVEVQRRLDEPPSTLGWRLACGIVLNSIKAAYAGEIDFNDQIYMPTLFTGSFPKFPNVFVDEYQDLNPLNHAIIRKLTKHGARLVGVGDPFQNIYGFRGAVAGGMAKAIAAHEMTTLPLSLSFRCPEIIVRGVHWHVPKMRWSRSGGSRIALANPTLSSIADDSVVICRNNAPLFALAMRLLAAGRSVSLAGSDVGPKIVALIKKLGDESLSRDALLAEIERWRADKIDKGSTTADDTAACMRVFAEYGKTLGEAVVYANHLFAQEGRVAMYTIHKAKGLEWERVYHLDPFLVRKEEPNLRYVCETRSSDAYFELVSGRIQDA